LLSILPVMLAIALLAATLIARSPLTWWWIRACEFPRLQIAVLAALTALLALTAPPPGRGWPWRRASQPWASRRPASCPGPRCGRCRCSVPNQDRSRAA